MTLKKAHRNNVLNKVPGNQVAVQVNLTTATLLRGKGNRAAVGDTPTAF